MTHVIVVDLGYGDAGKGTVVDWLCATREVRAVVRFNGGAQAGHNVVLPDGRHHTFAQFGSGTFHHVPTYLSRHTVLDPAALAAEAAHLAALGVPDPFGLLTVDGDALLATPYHRAANRARELARGADRHGSCGMGVGEAVRYALDHPGDAPRVADCASPATLARKFRLLRDRLAAIAAPARAGGCGPAAGDRGGPVAGTGDRGDPVGLPPVEDCVSAYRAIVGEVSVVDSGWLARLLAAGPVVFEGAQGVLLDEWHGFHPYTTWSTTTTANAESLLADAGRSGSAVRLGVLRPVTTRHGPGPLVTEDAGLAIAEPHNTRNQWQGAFRFGHFDAVAHRYALAATGGVDALALTHLDTARRHPELGICTGYRDMPDPVPGPPGDLDRQARLARALFGARPVPRQRPGDWVSAVRDSLGVAVAVRSYGPTFTDKRSSVQFNALVPPYSRARVFGRLTARADLRVFSKVGSAPAGTRQDAPDRG